MKFDGLFIYVDGFDNEEFAPQLLADLEAFKARATPGLLVVNDRADKDPEMGPEDFPEWNLGLNVRRSGINQSNLESVFSFLIECSARIERDFVVGCVDTDSRTSEDIAFFGKHSNAGDMARIVSAFAVGEALR